MVYFPAGTYLISSSISKYHTFEPRITILRTMSLFTIPCFWLRNTLTLHAWVVPYYYTSLIGNPNSMPTIKASAAFSGMGLINGNPYYTESLNWVSTNVFFRQVRNLIVDTTGVAAASSIEGMHWPTSQATSIQNVVFNLNADATSAHVGLFIENGSAGFLSDLVFNGGLYGAQVGNQRKNLLPP